MFTFPVEVVRRVIARGRQDAAANGGFRIPYYGTRPGEGEQSGFWLVGDQGVTIMSNGKLAGGQSRSSSIRRNVIREAIPTGGITSDGISGGMTVSSSSTPVC